MPDPQHYYQQLRDLYARQANPENARSMKRYMRGQFDYFGIKTPERKMLSQEQMAHSGIPRGAELKALCRLCFKAEERELQHFVNDLLQIAHPYLDASFFDLYEELLGQKSWWDTVDFIAPKLAGRLFLDHPDQIVPYTGRWIESDNFWHQRAAIIFQLLYKQQTDAALLFNYIRRRADSKEFFVQKAAGWALRQYARTEPETVAAFMASTELAPLTVREGSKHLNRKK